MPNNSDASVASLSARFGPTRSYASHQNKIFTFGPNNNNHKFRVRTKLKKSLMSSPPSATAVRSLLNRYHDMREMFRHSILHNRFFFRFRRRRCCRVADCWYPSLVTTDVESILRSLDSLTTVSLSEHVLESVYRYVYVAVTMQTANTYMQNTRFAR